MHKVGFDREKYLTLQGERIEARRRQFGGKLYLSWVVLPSGQAAPEEDAGHM